MKYASRVLVSAALLAVGCSRTPDRDANAAAPLPRPVLEVERERDAAQRASPLVPDRDRHDFGRVLMSGGDVETEFQVRNGSRNSVRLTAVYTSCGCTTAVLHFEDGSELGPFGMPGHEWPTRLRRALGPGERVHVRVRFDPAAHGPAGLGRVVRAVALETEDGGRLQLLIGADVVAS